MAAFPVNLPATSAAIEFIIIFAGQGFQLIQNLLLRHDLDQAVAQGATPKGPDIPPDIETVEHLWRLQVRVDCTYPVTMPDLTVKQQSAVARQNSALFPGTDSHDFLVPQIVAPLGIKTQEAQVAGQFSQVHVHDEPWVSSESVPG